MASDYISTIYKSVGYHVEHQQCADADQLNYNVKLGEQRNCCCAKPYINNNNKKKNIYLMYGMVSFTLSLSLLLDLFC